MDNKQLNIDDDLYKSIGVKDGAGKTVYEKDEVQELHPEFRKIPKHFFIKYSSPFKDMAMEEFALMKEKEIFYLKILFIAILFLAYGLI